MTDSTNQWVRVGQAASYQMGGYHNFAEYNPVHKVLVFGGGNDVNPRDGRKIWKLNASGQVTALKDAPADLGTTHSIFTVDPVSGKYLVFTESQQFYAFDVVTDTWALQASGSAVPIWTSQYGNPVMEVVGGPIDTYGVNVFVTCDGGNNCKV